MNYHAITLSVADHVAWLTLNRPEVHNAFDDRMIAELLDALAAVRNNNQVRVLVLRSEGKNFSAGADLGWMRSMAAKDYDENIADAAELSRLMQELDELPQPTIALVQGAAFGGAVGLAACCDIALATPASSFCLSEVKIGLIPAVISPYVMRAIGTRQARRYMLTAERFSAEEALRIGLVHDVAEDLQQTAQPLIEALINNSPAAVTAAKSLAMAVDQQPLNANTRQLTIERIAEIRVSAEGQEGLSAFLEKRAPNWKTTNE
jgi:methylglutaconyl-CoA hydratase